MNPTKLFPLVVTNNLVATRDFYTKKVGFEITMEMDQYLQVRYGDGPELSFMQHSGDANASAHNRPFGGQGLIISIPTGDPDAKCAHVRDQGAPITCEPSDKPWGWRSFMTTDPNGVALDFFKVLNAPKPSPEQSS